MADGKITIDVEVNGNKLSSLSNDLKKVESDAKRSGDGFKQASDKIKQSGDQAKNSGQGFKQAGDTVKQASDKAKTGGQGFKDASDRVKQAGDTAKTGGDGFQQSADRVRQSGEQARTGGQGFKQAGQDASESGDKAQKGSKGFESLAQKIKEFSVGAVAFKAISAGMDLINASMDRAINRFDTLERFPRVMKSLGFSAEDVAKSTKMLTDGIEGLPTTLDEVAKTTQQLTSMTGDLKTSTKLTLALNNAFLASGMSASDASRGFIQFSQMLAKGKVDLQSWRTLQETMPYALQKTAESFGFAGTSAQTDFYGALRDGQVTFKDFSKRLIELNEGVGGFAEMAKKNSRGIKTSWENIITAFAIGIEQTIRQLNKLSKAMTGKDIADNLDQVKYAVRAVFGGITTAISAVVPVVKTVNKVLGFLKPVLDPLIAAVAGATAAFIAFKAAMLAMAVAGAIKGFFANLVQSLLSFISTATAAEGATLSLGTALSSLSTGGIALIIGAIAGAVMWLKNFADANDEGKQAAEKQKQALDSLHSSLEQSRDAYKDKRTEIQAEAEDTNRLINRLEELSHIEKKTSGQKKELASIATTLNQRIEGLNIQFDKQAGTVNMSADAIRKYAEASKAAAESAAAYERQVELAKERLKIESKIREEQALMEKSTNNAKDSMFSLGFAFESSTTKAIEHGENLKKLGEDLEKVEKEQNELTDVITKSSAAQAAATEDATGRQILSWNTMSDEQHKVVEELRSQYSELKSEVQNAFQAIEQQTVVSVDQMIANLEKNIAAVDQWATNLEILAERGLNQGLLEELRKAGPKAAEQAQALVNASDEQLSRLDEIYEASGEKAKEGLFRGLKATGEDLAPEVQAMVTAIGDEFRSALADAGFDVKGREAGEKAANGMAEGFGTVGPKLTEAKDKIGFTFDEIATNIQTKGQAGGEQAGQAIVTGVQQGAAGLAGVAQNIGAVFNAGIANMPADGNNKGSGAGQGVADGINNKAGIAGGAAASVAQRVAQGLAPLPQTGQTKGTELGAGVTGGIGSQIGAAAGAALNLRTSATNQLQGLYNSGSVLGSALGEGMSSGIYSMIGHVIAAAQSIASAAVSAASSLLKINSPSKVMRDKVGKAIPEGMAVGIEKYDYFVDNSMKDLTSSIVASGKRLTAGFGLGLSKPAAIANNLVSGRFGAFNSVPVLAGGSSNVTNNYTLNANGQAQGDFFTPDNMRRLLKEMAYYTNQERGRM